MKVLVWIICCLVYGVVITVLNSNGIMLGGIPTAALFMLTWWVASTLCKRYDAKHSPENSSQEVQQSQITECKACGFKDTVFFNPCPKCGEYVRKNNRKCCTNCGAELIDKSEFCRKCGADVVKKTDSKLDEN